MQCFFLTCCEFSQLLSLILKIFWFRSAHLQCCRYALIEPHCSSCSILAMVMQYPGPLSTAQVTGGPGYNSTVTSNLIHWQLPSSDTGAGDRKSGLSQISLATPVSRTVLLVHGPLPPSSDLPVILLEPESSTESSIQMIMNVLDQNVYYLK